MQATPIDSFLAPLGSNKGVISQLYNLINSLDVNSLNKMKSMRGEEDLVEELSDEVWQDALHWVHSSSVCSRLNLIQLNIIHCTHLTKIRLATFYSDLDPTCDSSRHIYVISFGPPQGPLLNLLQSQPFLESLLQLYHCPSIVLSL